MRGAPFTTRYEANVVQRTLRHYILDELGKFGIRSDSVELAWRVDISRSCMTYDLFDQTTGHVVGGDIPQELLRDITKETNALRNIFASSIRMFVENRIEHELYYVSAPRETVELELPVLQAHVNFGMDFGDAESRVGVLTGALDIPPKKKVRVIRFKRKRG
jgi:hypothetical protein